MLFRSIRRFFGRLAHLNARSPSRPRIGLQLAAQMLLHDSLTTLFSAASIRDPTVARAEHVMRGQRSVLTMDWSRLAGCETAVGEKKTVKPV